MANVLQLNQFLQERGDTLPVEVSDYLRALSRRWSYSSGVADFSVKGYSGPQIAGDEVVKNAAGRVFVIFWQKANTSTDVAVKTFDDASNANTAGDQEDVLYLDTNNEWGFLAFGPNGKAFGTGIVLAAHTASEGTTDSTGSDVGSGFVVYR